MGPQRPCSSTASLLHYGRQRDSPRPWCTRRFRGEHSAMRRFVAFLLLSFVVAGCEVPRSAYDFSNSIGVGTHPTYFDTPGHATGPAGEARLAQTVAAAGIRHVRNGMAISTNAGWNAAAWDNMASWGRAGVVSSWGIDRCGFANSGGATIRQYLDKIAQIDSDRTDAIEGTNEPNLLCADGWPTEEREFQTSLYMQAKGHPDALIRSTRVLGPSVIFSGNREAGNYSSIIDRRNTHQYSGCRSPTPDHVKRYGLDYDAPADPANHSTWVTEVGFHTAVNAAADDNNQPPCSEATAANYTLRTLLEHFKQGIRRSYIYEAIDLFPDPGRNHPEWNFGMLRADFSEKPAFTAVRRLIATIGYCNPTLSLPGVTVETHPADLRWQLLQRAVGDYVLALWRTASVWNPDTRTPITVAPASVTVRAPYMNSATVSRPLDGTNSPVPLSGGKATLSVAGEPLLLLFHQ